VLLHNSAVLKNPHAAERKDAITTIANGSLPELPEWSELLAAVLLPPVTLT